MSSEHRVRLHLPDGSIRELRVGEDQHIWDAAHTAGIELPSICHQGRCLTCAGRLLEAGEFDASDAVAYFPEDRAAGFILLRTAFPFTDLEIRTHRQFVMRQHRRHWVRRRHIRASVMRVRRQPSAFSLETVVSAIELTCFRASTGSFMLVSSLVEC
jgi:ferredoxin